MDIIFNYIFIFISVSAEKLSRRWWKYPKIRTGNFDSSYSGLWKFNFFNFFNFL